MIKEIKELTAQAVERKYDDMKDQVVEDVVNSIRSSLGDRYVVSDNTRESNKIAKEIRTRIEKDFSEIYKRPVKKKQLKTEGNL
tara:strand:+ start:283 stop:534 length:252 start_codon:yes stop_codon:yes gene_type:complete